MAWWFASGHAVDLVLTVMLAELVWLVRWRGWSWRTAVLRLGPGALMLGALRVALTGGGWPSVALLLMLSLPVHLADVLGKEERRPGADRRADDQLRSSA